jgi:AraC-like DNA-binding protein
MFQSRQELLAKFKNPVFMQHPSYFKGVRTFSCIPEWDAKPVIELPLMRIEILDLDYIEYGNNTDDRTEPLQLRFQQDCFRLWFQVDGNGILQNTTRNIFGTARPGLLGITERSQRYTYLHQKGTFECFQLLFSLLPSHNAKCYWNSEIEGKTVLEGRDRQYFEDIVFDLLLMLSRSSGKASSGLSTTSRLLEILVVLFNKGLLVIEDTQFPKNKQKSLVAKAMAFMALHYARMRHQRDLEAACGVDINYLNILFKKEKGATLYDFLSKIRMEHAKHLLETTRHPVTAIASRTGYPNSNSFSRAFKHREKCTPLAYRDKCKGNAR